MIKKSLIALSMLSAIALGSSAVEAKTAFKKAPTNADDFAQYMIEKHGFEPEFKKYIKAVTKRQSILDAMSRPAEGKDWHEYRPIFLTQKRIKQGVQFMQKHEETLRRAEEQFQVPAEVITAIIGVETFYGRIQGTYPVVEAVSTLAFHYPRRAEFFASELEHYFLLARDENWEYNQPKGSYAGAMGMGQFISSSYRNDAIDFDGDGKINLFNNPVDAIGSVANYFKNRNWKYGEPVVEFLPKLDAATAKKFKNKGRKPQYSVGVLCEQAKVCMDYDAEMMAGIYAYKQKNSTDYWIGYNNFNTILRYNTSPMYALAVFQLSQEIKADAAMQAKKK